MYSVASRRPGDTSLQTGVKFILYISRGPHPALKLSRHALKLHAASWCVRESVIETRGEVVIHHCDCATYIHSVRKRVVCGGNIQSSYQANMFRLFRSTLGIEKGVVVGEFVSALYD